MRLHKSPFWHLSQEQGAWCYSVYTKLYHPRAYVKPEDGGLMRKYKYRTNDVTMWNVAVERKTCVKVPDVETLVDQLTTRRVANLSIPCQILLLLVKSPSNPCQIPLLLVKSLSNPSVAGQIPVKSIFP